MIRALVLSSLLTVVGENCFAQTYVMHPDKIPKESCQRLLLTPEAQASAVEKVKTLNSAFRPLALAFSKHVSNFSLSDLRRLDLHEQRYFVGVVTNLSIQMQRMTVADGGRHDYGRGRYEFGLKDVPAPLRAYLRQDAAANARYDSAIQTYGFSHVALKPPTEGLVRSKQTFWRLPPHGSEFLPFFGLLVAPCGEYGPDLLLRLARTTSVLMELAASPEFSRTVAELPKLENADFERKNDSNGGEYSAEQRALYEGISSIYQGLAILTASKVDGLNGAQLVEKLIESPSGDGNGFLANFARMLPMGTLGPMSNNGEYFPNPLALRESGMIVLNTAFRDFLLARQNHAICDRNRGFNKDATTLGCPVAHRPPEEQGKSSLQILNELFLRVFKQLG